MAQSYYIYIRDTTEGNKNPTNPEIFEKEKEREFNIKEAKSEIAEAIPIVGKVIAVVKAIEKTYEIGANVANTVLAYAGRESGDYEYVRNFNNFNNFISTIKDLPSALLNRTLQYQEMRLTNQKIAEQRVLVGDSYINKGFKGV